MAATPNTESLPPTPLVKVPLENTHQVHAGAAGPSCRFFLKKQLIDKYNIQPGDTIIIAIIKVIKNGEKV